MKQSLVAIAVATLMSLSACTVSVAPGFNKAEASIELSADSAGITALDVRWVAGNVTIQFDNTASGVTVTGTREAFGADAQEAENRLDQVDVTLATDPNDASKLVLRLTGPVVSSAYPWAAEAVVTLPAGVTLDIENDAGSIDVEGNNGATTVAVEAGNVAISDNTGDVDINLDAGNVFLSRTTGVATVDVDAGDISVTGQSGDLTATFDNGEAGIQSNAGNVTARGENGDIIITAAPPANGSVIVELVNGTIEIAVPATFAADLDLQSTFGLVRDDLSSFTVTNLQRSPATFSNVVTATLNGGGGTIQADLLTGTIRFEGL